MVCSSRYEVKGNLSGNEGREGGRKREGGREREEGKERKKRREGGGGGREKGKRREEEGRVCVNCDVLTGFLRCSAR